MSYACFMCERIFKANSSCMQHLNNYHDWESENENLNAYFSIVESWNMRCLFCGMCFDDLTAYLHHVLSSCPSTDENYLYLKRHDKVLDDFREAVFERYDDKRDWKVLSVLENRYYKLPLGIQNAPGGRSPDILLYSRARRESVIIELSVPWETNIPQARLNALERMRGWSEQFEERGYDCDCFTVEVGARGMVSNSFEDCLKYFEYDDDEISDYAERCTETALECSMNLLQGGLWGF